MRTLWPIRIQYLEISFISPTKNKSILSQEKQNKNNKKKQHGHGETHFNKKTTRRMPLLFPSYGYLATILLFTSLIRIV